jgi:hypothetical protein
MFWVSGFEFRVWADAVTSKSAIKNPAAGPLVSPITIGAVSGKVWPASASPVSPITGATFAGIGDIANVVPKRQLCRLRENGVKSRRFSGARLDAPPHSSGGLYFA